MSINGRFAIPSNQHEVKLTTIGMGALDLNEKGETGGKKENKKRGSPTMKLGARTPRGRGKRNSSKRVDPKQKLISTMLYLKGENDRDRNNESGTQGQ